MVETKAEAAEPGLIVGKWVRLDQPLNMLDLKKCWVRKCCYAETR